MSLEPENIAFKYRYLMATDQNLRISLNDNPIGLHFAGHGFHSKEDLFKTDKKAEMKNGQKGAALLFEKNTGASSYFFEEDLKEIL